jgi:zinc-binding alcohol dehydrogenase/oxidoreductase
LYAAVLDRHGPPEVLDCREWREPVAGPGLALVALRAAALNRRDCLIRAGLAPTYRFDLPLILGSDGSGVRRDTGEEVVILPSIGWGPDETVSAPDFEILGGPADGTYAELVAVPEQNLFPKPAALSWEEAAALPLAALTAHRALFAVGRLTADERLVVLGAGSGVSLAAIQLGLHAGARVAVTSSSPAKLARAVELGADVGVDYRHHDWVDELLDRHGGADLVLDSVGTTWQDSVNVLKPGGRLVSCGGTGGGEVTVDVRTVYLQQKQILGTKMGSPRDFVALLKMAGEGAIRPIIDSVRPLAEVAEAHSRIESGQHFGKLVLSIG